MTRGSRVQLGVLLILQTVMAVELVLLFVLLIGWQFGTDHLVPDAVRGAVSGCVAQLVPRRPARRRCLCPRN